MLFDVGEDNLEVVFVVCLVVDVLRGEVFLKGFVDEGVAVLSLFVEESGSVADECHKAFGFFLRLVVLELFQRFDFLTEFLDQFVFVDERAAFGVARAPLRVNPVRETFHQAAQVVQLQVLEDGLIAQFLVVIPGGEQRFLPLCRRVCSVRGAVVPDSDESGQ